MTWLEVLEVQLANRGPGLVFLESSLMVLINIISAVGNITLCYVIYKTPSLHTRTNTYIITLAVSDTLMALLVMPLTSGVLIRGKRIFGELACQIQGFTYLSLGLISLLTMALIAINRYFCVVRPALYQNVFSRRKSFAMVVGICIVGLINTIVPLVLQIGSFQFWAGRASCYLHIPQFQTNVAYTSIGLSVFVLTPFCVMVCCYTLVFRKIRQHQTNNTLHAPDGRAEEIKTTRLLFVLVVGFSACWIPYIVIELTESILSQDRPVSRSAYLACVYLVYLSSAINPVLYGTLNRPFRRAAVRLFPCCQRNNVQVALSPPRA